MWSLSDQLIIWSSVISAVATFLTAVVSAVFLQKFLREKSKSHYDDERHKAVISDMRTSYEAKIRDLTQNLTATESRWKDLNHLLISSQNAIGQKASTSPVPFTEFLQKNGISKNDLSLDPKLVLVLMPFNPVYDEVYEVIVAICRRAGLTCVRGDEERAPGDILSHILKIMVKARVIIAEVTERNPNVYYELGLAHSLDKPTILIAQKLEDVPFDIRSVRILIYNKLHELRSPLTESLLQTVAAN